MKVDFILIGAGKAGTTTLSKILKHHPEINFCSLKEPHFFSTTKNWKEDIGNYHNLFSDKKGKMYGEASTSYTAFPHFNLSIWNDIYEYNPNMKFIYIVRNPIDRTISHYMQKVQRGRINCSLEEALVTNSDIINQSRYYMQIKPYIDLFGRENILIIDFDDIKLNIENVLRDISKFLGIKVKLFQNINKDIHVNASVKTKKMHYKLDRIVRFLAPVINKFPFKTRKYVRESISSSKRVFKEKPKLDKVHKNLIINMVYQDIKNIEKISGKNFSKWLKL